ncbi:BmGPI7, B microti specific [Babesia microti strain RI]|uniref:BmGPI7, B microti specific n=1 Tax=Babesia microti (strain RI) TaxID=1133968 RepID=I7I8U4_BABMR|nr:BmGPI7, B microti specific [Babesia microti strain RI]CCF73693.1 BmGPI7, B microti specific [Babesia microti strain RI]|eukprot:XP_012648302.1 BmGPI7, B microti specific [Babesia microti strain RI]
MNEYLIYCIVSVSLINGITASIKHKISSDIVRIFSDESLNLNEDTLPKWITTKYHKEGDRHRFDLTVDESHKLKYILWDGIKKEITNKEVSKYRIYLCNAHVFNAKLTLVKNNNDEFVLIENMNLTKIPLWMKMNLIAEKYHYKKPIYVDIVNLPKEIAKINIDGIELVKLSNDYSENNFIKGIKWDDIWEYICPDGFEINDLAYEKIKTTVYLKITLKDIDKKSVKMIEKKINLNEKISNNKTHKTYLRRYLGSGNLSNKKLLDIDLHSDELSDKIEALAFYNKILIRINPEVSNEYGIGSLNWIHKIYTSDGTYIHASTIEPLEINKLLLSIYYSHGGEIFIARHLNMIEVDKIPNWIKKINESIVSFISDNKGTSFDLCEETLPTILTLNQNNPDFIMLKVKHDEEIKNRITEISMDSINITNIKYSQPLDRILIKREENDIYINILTKIYDRWNYDFSSNLLKLSCKKTPGWLKFEQKGVKSQMTLDLTRDVIDPNISATQFKNLLILEANHESGYYGMHNISWNGRWMYTTDNMPIGLIILESIDRNLIEITLINLSFYNTTKYNYKTQLVKIPNWISAISKEFSQEYAQGKPLDISNDTLPSNIISRNYGSVIDLESKNIYDAEHKISKIIWKGEVSNIQKGLFTKATLKIDDEGFLDAQIEYIDGRDLRFDMFKSTSKGKTPLWIKEINKDMAKRMENKIGVTLKLCENSIISEMDVNHDEFQTEFVIKEDLKKTNDIIGVDWGTGADFISYEDEIIEKVNLNKKNKEILITKSIMKDGISEKRLDKGVMKCTETPKWFSADVGNNAMFQTLTTVMLIVPLYCLTY